nr:hypothetical protein [Gammaproteobacteria bacterium]
TNRVLAESLEQIKVLNSEILALESQGFSVAKLEEITNQLRELGRPINVRSREDVSHLLETIDQNIKDLTETLENHTRESDELRTVLSESLGSTDPEGQDLEGKLTKLKERLIETATIQEKLGRFSSSLPWPIERPIVELVVEAGSVRKVAGELQAAIGKEQQANASYTALTKRKDQISKQLEKLLPQIKRYSKANAVLTELQKNYSLNSAMETSLQENRTAIEAIFSQIHSPAEFRGLGKNWSTLVRKMDKGVAKLTEISTGQRAAFALSVFLAQNAKLKVAPSVVLIDDPIAHIDDMNSLSFLDYLREVALKGQRQIYFSTANEKLADLFERKFDFLGPEEFRRFNLVRNT